LVPEIDTLAVPPRLGSFHVSATRRPRQTLAVIAAIALVASLAACAYPTTGVHVTGRTHGVAAVAASTTATAVAIGKHHRIRVNDAGDDLWTQQRKTSARTCETTSSSR